MTLRYPPDPFHPAYGVDMATRLMVLRHAETFGVRAAAERHRYHETTIRRWRKRMDNAELKETRPHD